MKLLALNVSLVIAEFISRYTGISRYNGIFLFIPELFTLYAAISRYNGNLFIAEFSSRCKGFGYTGNLLIEEHISGYKGIFISL